MASKHIKAEALSLLAAQKRSTQIISDVVDAMPDSAEQFDLKSVFVLTPPCRDGAVAWVHYEAQTRAEIVALMAEFPAVLTVLRAGKYKQFVPSTAPLSEGDKATVIAPTWIRVSGFPDKATVHWYAEFGEHLCRIDVKVDPSLLKIARTYTPAKFDCSGNEIKKATYNYCGGAVANAKKLEFYGGEFDFYWAAGIDVSDKIGGQS